MKSSTSTGKAHLPLLNRRHLLLVVFTVALAAVAFRAFGDGRKALALLDRAALGWVGVAVVLQIGTYGAAAWALSVLTRYFGHPVSRRRLAELAIVTVFLNNAFPAGGASGATFLSKTLKRDGIPVHSSVLLTVLYYLASWIAFFVFLAGTFAYLSAANELTSVQRTLGLVAVALAALLVFSLMVLVRSEARFAAWLALRPESCGAIQRQPCPGPCGSTRNS